jgi:molybdopterin-synthase adenylyltransferase
VNDAQLQRYSRHILLDEIGFDAQQRLLDATILVIGAGGLGSPVAMYLAAAGIGHLIIADGDTVDLTNLQRQIIHSTDSIGQAKVQSAAQAIAQLNPDVKVTTINARLSDDDLLSQVRLANVVVDCTDNFVTRHDINRACVAAKVPLVCGAAIRFDGQLMVFNANLAESPCYHCVFAQSAEVTEELCALMGVFAPVTGIVGTLQAAEALKLAGQFGQPAIGQLMMINALDGRVDCIAVKRDPHCLVCGR